MTQDRENRTGFGVASTNDLYPEAVSEADKRALLARERRISDDYDLDAAWWIESESIEEGA